jgi:hypothetical protein
MTDLNLQQQATLIRELFFHRLEIFANHYYNKRLEKEIWGPARDYNGADRPYNWAESDSHFSGKTRIGTYPHDWETNTCRWIVADYDDNENAWAHCLATYRKLQELGIVSHMERSKSGKGYHLWVFFNQAVIAPFARRMMKNTLHLADVPMTGKFQKGGKQDRSMDRFFPAADKLSPHEYGNLVALPYQGVSVKEGNTVFVDIDGNPYTDKWEYLLNCWNTRIDPTAVHVQKLHDMVFEDVDYSTRSGSNASNNYWAFVGEQPDREEQMRGCEAIKASIENANQFSEPAWQDILSSVAILGSAGRDLAHDVSRGYNRVMEKNDTAAQYDADETDRKYFKKVDRIQRGGYPSGCNKLAENGWTCPHIKTCEWKMIATFGTPPSININPPLSVEEMQEVRQLEDQGFYEKYRGLLPASKYCQVLIEEDRDTGKPAWIPIKLRDLEILKHLVGNQEIRVKPFDGTDDTVISMYQSFDIVEEADAFQKAIEDHEFEYVRQGNSFWLLSEEKTDRHTAVGVVIQLMKIAGIKVEEDFSNVSLSNFGLINNEWVLAPYHDRYVDAIVIFDIQ